MLAHGPIKPNHVSLLTLFCDVGLVVRLNLNFILVKASIHPCQSNTPSYLLTAACSCEWMNVVHVTKIQTQFHRILKAWTHPKFCFQAIIQEWSHCKELVWGLIDSPYEGTHKGMQLKGWAMKMLAMYLLYFNKESQEPWHQHEEGLFLLNFQTKGQGGVLQLL
jgi:hypothetical protein